MVGFSSVRRRHSRGRGLNTGSASLPSYLSHADNSLFSSLKIDALHCSLPPPRFLPQTDPVSPLSRTKMYKTFWYRFRDRARVFYIPSEAKSDDQKVARTHLTLIRNSAAMQFRFSDRSWLWAEMCNRMLQHRTLHRFLQYERKVGRKKERLYQMLQIWWWWSH